MSHTPTYEQLQQEYKKTLDELDRFKKLVYALREAEKRFVKTHSSLARDEMVKLQIKVDNAIQYLHKKHVVQTQMF